PVIGVPIGGGPLAGVDALYAIVQMPTGVPVASMAINGAQNAGLYAAQLLAMSDSSLRSRLWSYRRQMAEKVRARDTKLMQTWRAESEQ
ncbi:MAG: AIR carboxylase family protein, partial [Firmicutes bacterium]|nr:AIR carboxylase family protein [Bacillota bacterium]